MGIDASTRLVGTESPKRRSDVSFKGQRVASESPRKLNILKRSPEILELPSPCL